jgi:hypothetical protein
MRYSRMTSPFFKSCSLRSDFLTTTRSAYWEVAVGAGGALPHPARVKAAARARQRAAAGLGDRRLGRRG